MGMKNLLGVYTMMAMAGMGGPSSPNSYGKQRENLSEKEAERLRFENEKKYSLSKGLKEFHYSDINKSFFARDKKNADRKYQNYLKSL